MPRTVTARRQPVGTCQIFSHWKSLKEMTHLDLSTSNWCFGLVWEFEALALLEGKWEALLASSTASHFSCWCSVGNEGMNLVVPLKETTSWMVYSHSISHSLHLSHRSQEFHGFCWVARRSRHLGGTAGPRAAGRTPSQAEPPRAECPPRRTSR